VAVTASTQTTQFNTNACDTLVVKAL